MLLQPAKFVRRYDRLKAQYAEISEARSAHPAGGEVWRSLTRSMDRIMSGMMDIECGFKPNFLEQTQAQMIAKREIPNHVTVQVRHSGSSWSIDIPAEPGQYDLRSSCDRAYLASTAGRRVRERGSYWVF